MKILVAGSRSITSKELIYESIDKFIDGLDKTSISFISGGAKGVDCLAEQYAKDNNYHIEVVKPQWDKYGKGAGIKRNIEMIDKSDLVICVYDGQSKGTKFNIDYCKKNNKKCEVVLI